MSIQRCPECGIRLKSSYCDVCMKRVPFKGMPVQQTFRPRDASSAHRTEEGHTCVSFGEDKKKSAQVHQKKQATFSGKKHATIVAIVLALLSLLPSLFGVIQDVADEEPAPEPEAVVVEDIPVIEPQQLYNDGKVIIVADYAASYYDDYTVFMTVVNDSEEDIVVFTDLLSVNGFMHDSTFYAEVEAGESVQESLQIYSYERERDGIEEVAEIAFYFDIYPENYSEQTRSDLITLTTEAADTYEQPPFLDGWELYTDEDMALRLVSYGDNSGNYELRFFMENLSQETVSISTTAIRINGEETDGYLWDTLRAGTCSQSEIYLSIPGIEDLSEINEITLDLLIERMDGYEIIDSRTETVTFVPEN